ncbi:uncharacterized protein B4U80_03878 [Leptotrombidium deliense]|uniref:MH2 domain-containing protein n=1 Tax=Leptotrombidium deliense TaxID=299467 RepID=A0A443SLJ8_9ACAR|nr:uncharacterized protein B4U80_03878 [Leptotrombidium deliense]
MKMDECGNILIKRLSKSDVFVKPLNAKKYCNSLGSDIEDAKGKLEFEKASILFDMKKFHSNIAHELKGAYPDRKNLETQCITCVAFGKCCEDLLQIPSWIMVINVVALELVKCKIPPIVQKIPKFVSIFCAQKLAEASKVAQTGDQKNASTTNDEKKETQVKVVDDEKQVSATVAIEDNGNKNLGKKVLKLSKQDLEKMKLKKMYMKNNDPYYCGLSAKVSKFEKRKAKSDCLSKENFENDKNGSEGAYYHIYSSIPEINKISRHSADEITIPANEKYRYEQYEIATF